MFFCQFQDFRNDPAGRYCHISLTDIQTVFIRKQMYKIQEIFVIIQWLSRSHDYHIEKKQGVYIAHCPQSNTNLSSGISPARRYLDEGLHIGLGSDIAGGTSVSILRAMADAIQVSKLYWRLVDSSMKPLTVEEAFYMGTEGGGSFFGKVGSFKEGYEFDAVVLNDSTIPTPLKLSPKDRLERLIYLSDDRNITAKYVAGRKIL